MNRVVTTAAAAAAAASALLASAGTREARAQLVYESFNYPNAAPLEGKINPIDGQPWLTMSGNPADDDILLNSPSLSYPGLAAPDGNSVSFSGVGKSERLGFDRAVRSGTTYYSLVLRVNDLAAMTTTPTFIAGFSERAGEAGVSPTTVGARLYLRRSDSNAQTFQLGVSKNSTFDIAFDEVNHYALNTPMLLAGSYEIVGSGSGTNDIAKLYINPTSLGTAAPPVSTPGGPPILTAPVNGTDLTVGGVPSLAGFVLRQGSSAVTTVPNVQIDELRIDNAWARVTPPTGVTWSSSNGGAWSESSKWSTLAAPNSAEAFVNLDGNSSGARTIAVDQAIALRTLNITSSQPFTLAPGGAGTGLNFSSSAGVNVRAGSHTIATPIALGGETLFSVATGASLNVTGALAAGGNGIIKAGDGAMTVQNLRAGSADLIAGSVAIAPNGGPAGTSRVTSLAMGPQASLDLSNNKLIVANGDVGTFNGAAYTGLSGLIASAYNFSSWDGPGIRTSQDDADADDGLTTLAIATADEAFLAGGNFGGVPVESGDVLIMYTYAGDANLDGLVDGADYGFIDNYVQFPGSSGYANGDFNYDGVIDGADYGIIDNSIQLQGDPIAVNGATAGASLAGDVAAVPEPSACAAALMTIAGVLARRRR